MGLTACSPPFGTTCPAIGYFSVAHVTLSEPRPGVTLELCDGEECEPGPPLAPAGLQEIRTSAPPVNDDTGILKLSGNSQEGWSAEFIGGQPVIGYRLSAAFGEVITEGSVEVDWVRIGGTPQCGGPREARVTLPS